jgi:hypothetical protein
MNKRRLLRNAIILLVIGLFAFSPIIPVRYADRLATLGGGCQMDESGPHPCTVNGKEVGDTIYTLGMLGWFMLATIPLAALALGVFGLLLILEFALERRRRAETVTPSPSGRAKSRRTFGRPGQWQRDLTCVTPGRSPIAMRPRSTTR